MLNERSLAILATIDRAGGEFNLVRHTGWRSKFMFGFKLKHGEAKIEVELAYGEKDESLDDQIARMWETIAPLLETPQGRVFLGPVLEHKPVDIPF